ncbi:MAG: MinD/ParA family protein [Thiohalobacterales bacterium]
MTGLTRIITITSGLSGSGKTHLGINMALELVRKGRSVGLVHEGGGSLPVDQLISLPRELASQDRDDTAQVVRRGYQGIDLVTSRVPLSRWPAVDRQRLDALVRAHEVPGGYEDLLIDTSGMTPRTVISCCRLSPIVLLVVTPDPRSLAETFGLLKVLQLNGFDGQALLIANRVESITQAHALQAALSVKTMQYLDREVPLLGTVARDRRVVQAQRLRQAFTSLYPESRVSGDLVRLIDELDNVRVDASAHPASVTAFWNGLAGNLPLPVRIAGDVDLDDIESGDVPVEVEVPAVKDDRTGDASLLRFEGPLSRLDHVMQGFSAVMHFVANDMLLLHEHLADLEDKPEQQEDWSVADSTALELMLARVLRALLIEVDDQQQVCFQVEESPVDGRDGNWLRKGYYIKYIFLVPGLPRVIESISCELERLPGLRHSKGQDGECICEVMSVARDACLSVINTPQGEIRVNFWHQSGVREHPPVEQHARGVTADRSLDHHPVHKRLH